MALRVKKAIPGRYAGGRFIPNPKKSSIEDVLYRKFRKEGYSRSEAKRAAKINAPFFGGTKNPYNPMKLAVTMLKDFSPARGGLMLAGHRYYVRRSDAEELKRRGLARITHEGKRKRNPKGKPPVIHVWRDTNGKWTFTIQYLGSYHYNNKEFDSAAEARAFALENIGRPDYHIGTQEEWRHAKVKVYRGRTPSFTGIRGYY